MKRSIKRAVISLTAAIVLGAGIAGIGGASADWPEGKIDITIHNVPSFSIDGRGDYYRSHKFIPNLYNCSLHVTAPRNSHTLFKLWNLNGNGADGSAAFGSRRGTWQRYRDVFHSPIDRADIWVRVETYWDRRGDEPDWRLQCIPTRTYNAYLVPEESMQEFGAGMYRFNSELSTDCFNILAQTENSEALWLRVSGQWIPCGLKYGKELPGSSNFDIRDNDLLYLVTSEK